MTTNKFYEQMSERAKNFTRINQYAAFLLRSILNEIYLLNLAPPTLQGKYVNHPLPVKHPDFPYFPSSINHAHSSIYEREMEELANWVQAGNRPEHYPLYQKTRLAGKKSLLVQKILSCADDFAQHVGRISQEKAIPISSLTTLITTMTYDMEGYSPPSRDVNRQGHGSVRQVNLGPNILACDILISAAVRVQSRDRRILNAAKEIYDLFQEAFWVLMVSGMTDLVNTLIFARYNNHDNIKKYLLDRACFIQMEERVGEIKTYEDFYSYMMEEMAVFNGVFPSYSKLCMNYIRKAAAKRVRLTQTTSSISLQQYEESINRGDIYKAASDQHDQYIENISRGSEYPEASSRAPYSSDRLRVRLSRESVDDDFHDANSSGRRKKVDTRVDNNSMKGEILSLEHEITQDSVFRLLYEPLSTYTLRKRPENLIKYIKTIIDNRSYDLIHENYDSITKDMFGRSPRTLRRIEKEEFDKNLTGNFARIKRRGRTLSDVDTRHRINERENRRAHKLGGYWNREELVAELRKPSKIREANNNGIPLKIYSRTTLLKRIKNAVNKGLIKPKQVSRYYYFKYEDFLRIARAIA